MQIKLNVDVLTVNWGGYTFYQVSTRSKGVLLAIPFVLNNEMKGYLFYSDVDSYPMSDNELFKFGINAIVHANLSGMIGKLNPLPYNPVSKDDVLHCIEKIVTNNATINLGFKLYL